MSVGLHSVGNGAERAPRFVGNQRLAANCDRHYPGHNGHRDAAHLERLGAACNVNRGIGPHTDRAEMDASARLDAKRTHGRVIRERIANGIAGCLEQHEDAVGLVDLAAAPQWN